MLGAAGGEGTGLFWLILFVVIFGGGLLCAVLGG